MHDLKARRWANVAAIYCFLLLLSVLFMGPFVFAFLSSLKDNPTEWPPSLLVNQLRPANWAASYRLAKQGGGNGFTGGMGPGGSLEFEVTYWTSPDQEPVPPDIVIPKRVQGGAVMALRVTHWAADYVQVADLEEVRREPSADGFLTTYRFRLVNTGDVALDTVPMDLTVPMRQQFVSPPFRPTALKGRRTQSWNNVSAGLLPYVLATRAVFRELQRARTDCSSLIRNPFPGDRAVLTTPFFSMAGCLGPLDFRGRDIFGLPAVPDDPSRSPSFQLPGAERRSFGLLSLGAYTAQHLRRFDHLGAGGSKFMFIMKQFFERLPASMEESARIDGASTYTVFFRIMLPLAKPPLGALTILTFQGVWNEFFWPLVVITSPADKYPLTIGLLNLQRAYGSATFDWGPILAGTFISALPVIVLFIVFQQYFVEGISFSGTKG